MTGGILWVNCDYDCRVCGKKHEMKVRWATVSVKKLESLCNLDMRKETMRMLVDVVKKDFQQRHPGEIFDKELIKIGGPL